MNFRVPKGTEPFKKVKKLSGQNIQNNSESGWQRSTMVWPWTLITESAVPKFFFTLNFQLYVILGEEYIKT